MVLGKEAAMEQAIRVLQELRGMASVTQERLVGFLKLCNELKVPTVIIYSPGVSEGWWEMHKAYVFTSRTDISQTIWLFSRHRGLVVLDSDGKNGVPFEEWDPKADLFTDDSFFEGGTNMHPPERERLYRK